LTVSQPAQILRLALVAQDDSIGVMTPTVAFTGPNMVVNRAL